MTNKLLNCLIAGALGATFAIASPVLAFKGGAGGGGGGGVHVGGMGGGGMRVGGMGGGMGGGMRFSGISPAAHFSSSHFVGAPVAHTAAFSPRFSHFAFHDGFHHHHFFHHRFHRFAFFGAPYYYSYASYDDCWRRVWTRHGLQWVNVCGDYGYY
jgi:hypothetical protein